MTAALPLRPMAQYPGNQGDLSTSFKDRSVDQGVNDLIAELGESQNQRVSDPSHSTSNYTYYNVNHNLSSLSIASASSASSAQFNNSWLASHIPLLAVALQPYIPARVLITHFISYEMFRSLFDGWAVIIDFIIDIIITLTFRAPNFDWMTLWDAHRMAQLTAQALQIFFQVYSIISVEGDGFQWAASFIYWAQDSVVRLRNTIRRGFRGLWSLYNFSREIGSADSNVIIRDGWLVNGAFMHHWGVADGFCLYYANRAIMTMMGVVFYTSPQSIARRMYWLMSYFPDLYNIAPELSWILSAPETAWVTVAVGAQHHLGEWNEGTHVDHRWSSRVGVRFSEIRENTMLPGNRRFFENVCQCLAVLWAGRIMTTPVPVFPNVETPPDSLDD